MATTLNISLPEQDVAYIEAQTDAGHFSTPSQFIRELIHEDRDRRLRNLENDLRAALNETPIRISSAEIERGNLVATFREERLASR